jgi:hypothetical protein
MMMRRRRRKRRRSRRKRRRRRRRWALSNTRSSCSGPPCPLCAVLSSTGNNEPFHSVVSSWSGVREV